MSGALDGIRVLDLSRLLPGGFCSLLLADLGADVLKVEDTSAGDYVRWAQPNFEGVPSSASSALFVALNRNKRSIRIDLKQQTGREVLKRLASDFDVVLESFRPGVLDRLGVGYEVLREHNPGLVYCAISGYGQDGPLRDRSGHDMNYLGLVGLLGLSGDADAPPVQSSGQIADIGGGALMAAVGILAALRERERSGEGQLVDISMADGSLSWLALVAARYFATGVAPRRGQLELAGSLVCYRPYRCADGWVTLGALEPKFWQAFCRGVGREDLVERQFDGPGSDTHQAVQEIFAARTREQWHAFASEYDCCLEPLLELDEALESELVRAREMVVDVPLAGGASPARGLGVPIKLSRTPGGVRTPAPVLGEHTSEVLAAAGYAPDEIEAMLGEGAVLGPPPPTHPAEQTQGSFPFVNANGLKMSELAEASGVSSGTIKHYLREGLLGSSDDIVRTSRNMAYYPPDFVQRIRLIKRLQEERFMPLALIKGVIDDPARAEAIVELEDRILESAIRARESGRVSKAQVRRRYDIPANVLDRLEELGVLTPSSRGYDADDIAIVEALGRFRAGGYDERLGFTVYDTLRYREALAPLVAEEVGVLLERLAGEVEVDRAAEIIASGTQPLHDLIGAMHSKLLLAELRRVRQAS